MYKKKLLVLSLFLVMCVVIGLNKGYSQSLNDNYDKRERAVDPFEHEDKILRETRINDIIKKIQSGDPTVLKLVVFDTFEAVHDEMVRRARKSNTNYYAVAGNERGLKAFIGGFDNQDPKVRLKCIGYLGDWVDEVARPGGMNVIKNAVESRLATNIETRKEVRYGFRVLMMKIIRIDVLNKIKKGDSEILVRISPEEFLPLVFYEPRIRTIYLGSPGAVRIRSIVLDPGVNPETGELLNRKGRSEKLDIERICYNGIQKQRLRDSGEVDQWVRDANKAGKADAFKTGGGVGGGSFGATTESRANLDWACVQSIYGGVDNKSLFVREHSARIFLNYVRGYTGDPNYRGNVNTNTREYFPPNAEGGNGTLAKMARNPYMVRLAQVAWDNVKWSEYYYNDRVTSGTDLLSFIKHSHYLEYEFSAQNPRRQQNVSDGYVPAQTRRYFTDDARTYAEFGSEVTGNYRNDIKEILRILGLSWYIDAEYVTEGDGGVATGPVNDRRIDTLFNDNERLDRPKTPDRSDRLDGESDTESTPNR